MSGVNIEPYAGADLDTVAWIWLTSSQSTGLPFSKLASFDDLRSILLIRAEREWSVHVARIGAQIVGFIALHDNQVMELFVAPESQNKGVGKLLLDFARKQHPQGFHLSTPAESMAVRFYEREGLARGEVTPHARLGHPMVRFHWLPG